MGTVLDVTLVGPDEALLHERLEWTFSRVAALEVVASRHLEGSELNRFNTRAGEPPSRGWSADLRALLVRSRAAGDETGGAFDVTVGPLIGLWWRAVERGVWPSDEDIRAARALVGYEAIHVSAEGELGLSSPGRSVDFGGIAKGHALDVVKAGLEGRGVRRGLLDFGGSSVWALGRAPDGGPWRLEVDAREPARPRRVLELIDSALSVSSSLGESSGIAGRRVGHVIDPRTGRTIDVQRTAVAVGASATDAEIWSTALLVLEPGEGIERLSGRAGVEAWVRSETGEIRASPGFAPYWGEGERAVHAD